MPAPTDFIHPANHHSPTHYPSAKKNENHEDDNECYDERRIGCFVHDIILHLKIDRIKCELNYIER